MGDRDGYLEEAAFLERLRRAPMPGMEEILAAVERTQQSYASYGITTMQEGMVVPEMIGLLDLIASQSRLKLDLCAYAQYPNAVPLLEGRIPPIEGVIGMCGEGRASRSPYQKHFRYGGWKILLDGSPQARTAWLREPYEGGTERGKPAMSDAALDQAILAAGEEGVQLLTHCNGDAACLQLIDAMERCERRIPGIRELRFVMVHAQMLPPEQLRRMKLLGLIPSFFAAHILHFGDAHRENLGERAQRISPLASAVAAGVPFTLHQDSRVIPPDMAETLETAVRRRTSGGAVLGENERISAFEALKAVTVNGAYQYGEADKGALFAGARADLVVWEQDPLSVPEAQLHALCVRSCYKDGEAVYQRDESGI